MKSIIIQWIAWGRLTLFVMALVLGGVGLRAADGPPGLINYQGYLVDAVGNPLGSKDDGNGARVSDPTNYKVKFNIYDSQNEGNNKWNEEQVVTVDNGYFNVYLGETTIITTSVFRGPKADERFVGITVDLGVVEDWSDDSEIAPRLRLLSTPYAMLSDRALTADTLSSGATASGTFTVTEATSLKNTTADGTLTVTGVTSLKNTTADGTLTVTGTMTANKFEGHGTIPLGGIIMWSGDVAPNGWAICDGENDTPNLSGRFIVGIGKTDQAGATKYELGKSNVGQERVGITIAQLPDHTHSGTTNKDDGAHRHEGNDWWSVTSWDSRNWGARRTVIGTDSANYNGIQSRNSEHQHSFTTSPNKDFKGESHENRPPFYALAYIIRVQ